MGTYVASVSTCFVAQIVNGADMFVVWHAEQPGAMPVYVLSQVATVRRWLHATAPGTVTSALLYVV
jgi:hypothetical protein